MRENPCPPNLRLIPSYTIVLFFADLAISFQFEVPINHYHKLTLKEVLGTGAAFLTTFLTGAFMTGLGAGAFLTGAFLTGAFLAGTAMVAAAFLAGAFLLTAKVKGGVVKAEAELARRATAMYFMVATIQKDEIRGN